MSKNIKVLTTEFIKENKLTEVNYTSLKKAVSSLGYTVIEFSNIANDTDVETVIQNLNLGQIAMQSKGFTYADKNYRLVFINEGLSNGEKLLVLAHETGHIVCEHFSVAPIIGKDVKDEYEANEFCHYLLKKRPFKNIKKFATRHRKGLIAGAVVLFAAFIVLNVYKSIKEEDKYVDGYYITTTGDCYHEENCIFIKNKTNVSKLTKKDFEEGTYNPCNICLPGNN